MLLLSASLLGCESMPRVQVAEDSVRLTGIADAIRINDPTPPAAEDSSSLSAAQAIKLLLLHDQRIRAALARVRVAEADARQARLLPNPILQIDYRFPEAAAAPPTIEIIPTVDLIAMLQKPTQVKGADDRLRQAAADAITVILDAVEEVSETYATAQSLTAQLDAARNRVQVLKQLFDLSGKRLNAGEGTRLDVLTLQAQSVQAELDLSDVQLQSRQEMLALAKLTGQPRSAADWQLDTWQPPTGLQGEESTWVNAALAHRPEVSSKIWELAALGEELKIADLSVFNGDQIGVFAERDKAWAVGPDLSIPVPIFDMGQEAKAKARAQRQVAEHELTQRIWDVIADVRSARAAYAAAMDSLHTAQDRLVPLLQSQRSQAELAYKSGDSDLTTLLLAETNLQLTRARVLDLQAKAIVSLLRLRRAAGGGGIADDIAAAASTRPDTRPDTQP